MKPLEDLKQIAQSDDWQKFLNGDDFREMVEEIARLRDREKGQLYLTRMSTVHTCPNCQQKTVMWDSRAGSFWCSNSHCSARFARQSDLPTLPEMNISEILVATMIP